MSEKTKSRPHNTGLVGQVPEKFFKRRQIPKTPMIVVAVLAGMLGMYTLIHSFASTDLSDVQVQTFNSLTQLRPDKPIPSGGKNSSALVAAKNEYESFQLLIKAGSNTMNATRVDPGTPLTGPGGAQIPANNLMIYREVNYNVTQTSDLEGSTGQWPDALIPEKDAFYGETRNAFPVNIAPNGQVAVWVDVLVPANQAAGDYNGSVRVSTVDGTLKDVPVHLTVANFSLPSTASEKSMFSLGSYAACTAHTGAFDCNGDKNQAWQLEKLYAEAGLNNRTTIANPQPDVYGDSGAPAAPLAASVQTQFQQNILPLINGTDPTTQLSGASLTSLLAFWSCAHAGTTCLSDWKQLATQDGFSSKFYLYLCDEPYADTSLWNSECKPNATRASQTWPGVNRLITTSIQDANSNNGASIIDTIVPLVNDVDSRSGANAGTNNRPAYNSFLGQAGKQLWLYSSCRSFGCDNNSTDPLLNGWPGYAIDEPASEQRAMGWMVYDYGATGELYYNVGQNLKTAWTNQYISGGNGDGTLFYPGSPGGAGGGPAIGGSHDIPIESIRLKRIRDGREDYEYLKKLNDDGKGTQAMNVVQGLFGPQSTAMFSTAVSGDNLNSARCQLLQLITGSDPCAAAPPSDTTVPTVSLSSPYQGTKVSGQVPLTARAADDIGVSQVEFYVDGQKIATDTNYPYTATWKVPSTTGGSHTITAKAYDAAGNVGTSSVITVTAIANPPAATGIPKDGSVLLALANPGTPFAPTSFWNTLLPANTAANPNSSTYVNTILTDLSQEDAPSGALNSIRWSAPLYIVPASQSLVPVSPACNGSRIPNTDFVNNVLPGGIPIPANAHAAAGTDEHISIYQPSTDKLWEFWQFQKDSGGNWQACAGGRLDHVSTSDGIFPYPEGGWTTGLPLLSSIARIEELQAGHIDHVLGLGLPVTLKDNAIPANVPGAASGISWPANRSDGTSTDPLAIPEGQRFRLPASLDLNQYNLSPTAKTIAVAAQKYGFVVAYVGSVSIPMGDPTTYTAAGYVDPYISLYGGDYSSPGNVMQNFPWDKLQALPFDYGKPGSSTPPPADTTAPTVSFTSPANNATVSGIVTATANATDDTAVTKVEISLDSSLKVTDTTSPYNYSFDSKTLTNGTHTLSAKAYDAAGNTKTATITINVNNPDVTPPSAPTNLNATATSPTTVNLSWTASTDGGSSPTGVTKYNVLRNGVVIGQPSTASYTDTTVAANTNYSYTVQAVDGAGNVSNNSSAATITTPPAPDTAAPTQPTNLKAANATVGQVNLTWNASTDSGGSGLAGYNIYRGGTKLNTTPIASTSYGDSTASPGTTYSYTVQAVDGAGNKSAQTAAVSITTLAAVLGDITGPSGVPDGTISIYDLSYVIRSYNSNTPAADLTGPSGVPDGKVDLYDLSYIIRKYGG